MGQINGLIIDFLIYNKKPYLYNNVRVYNKNI